MLRTHFRKVKQGVIPPRQYKYLNRLSARHREEYTHLFETIERFCLFIGYPRSGHSLVGALLDAHPNVIMAHELNVLAYVRRGFDRKQLLYLIVENTRELAGRGRVASGFDHGVPGQWQGRWETVRVIGDKKGGGTTRLLMESIELLDEFLERVGLDTRAIHVIRNPFDNIATIARRRRHGSPVRDRDLVEATEFYFDRVRANRDVKARGAIAVLDVRLEDLIDDARSTVTAMSEFLGVAPRPDYVEACAEIVRSRPNKTRLQVEWPVGLRDRIDEEIGCYAFLEGYSFESG